MEEGLLAFYILYVVVSSIRPDHEMFANKLIGSWLIYFPLLIDTLSSGSYLAFHPSSDSPLL